MRDVAARAKVSIKTVSRVVNGEPTVAPELAERVRAAIKELDYRPHHAASSLRRLDGRSRTIAVVLHDLANPFSAALHRAVVDTAQERDVLVLAASSDEDPEDERQAAMAFAARRVDGLILMPTTGDQSWLKAEIESRSTMVMVDRPAEGVDAIVSDNRPAAAGATAHLVRGGHRRIGFLGDLSGIYTAHERLAGYREAVENSPAELDQTLIRMDLQGSEQAEQATIELLTGTDPPTGLFSGQNLLTIGAVRALHRLNLRDKIALIGFDDIEFSDILEPGVTVLAQDPIEIGRRAAARLLARIDGDSSPPRLEIVPTRLIPRGSGEIRAARPSSAAHA